MFLDYYLLIIDFKPIITLAFVVFLTQLITISLPNNLIVSNICHETHNFWFVLRTRTLIEPNT